MESHYPPERVLAWRDDMTIEELARHASYLAREWALTEAGEDDVLMWGATLSMRGYTPEIIVTHMEVRAEMIAVAEREEEELVSHRRRTIEGAA